MKFLKPCFALLQVCIQAVSGLVYAGYSRPAQLDNISSLDRYRCGEIHSGFEFTGYLVSTSNSCTGVSYGWSGPVPVDTEWNRKSSNCNVFNVPINLFREDANNYIEYVTEIPGDLTTGSRVEVVFEPTDPWNQIVLNLKTGKEGDVIIHISFRKDYGTIQLNSLVSGSWFTNINAGILEITTGKVSTLSAEVLADVIKVSVDGIEKYDYPHRLNPGTTRMVDFHASAGSTCSIKRICFYDLKQN